MIWLLYVALGTFSLTAYNLVTKIIGGKVEPLIATSIATVSSAVILITITLIHYYREGLSVSDSNVIGGNLGLAVLMGVCFTGINLGYIFAFAKGGPVGAVGPIISGGSIALVVISSIFLFGEGITLNKILGALFLGTGILFIMKG